MVQKNQTKSFFLCSLESVLQHSFPIFEILNLRKRRRKTVAHEKIFFILPSSRSGNTKGKISTNKKPFSFCLIFFSKWGMMMMMLLLDGWVNTAEDMAPLLRCKKIFEEKSKLVWMGFEPPQKWWIIESFLEDFVVTQGRMYFCKSSSKGELVCPEAGGMHPRLLPPSGHRKTKSRHFTGNWSLRISWRKLIMIFKIATFIFVFLTFAGNFYLAFLCVSPLPSQESPPFLAVLNRVDIVEWSRARFALARTPVRRHPLAMIDKHEPILLRDSMVMQW